MNPSFIASLPKAELHVHLDGSLRPETMFELAKDAGISMPANTPEALADHMRADSDANLEQYLSRFALTLSVMQTEDQLERIAYELALDHAAQNVRYVEVRYSPILNTEGGLTLEQALEAPLRGLARARKETGIRSAVIVCALRHLEADVSNRLAQVAVDFRDHGVVAFDLAAGEAGNPPGDHAEAFRIAAAGDLSRTVHAGEAWGPESIREAIANCGAHRIGHGTRLQEDPRLEAYVCDHQIPLEVCLTSNVQTGVAADYASHPVRRYFDLGIPVTLCTDNTLISGTTLNREFALAAEHLGFTESELADLARTGFEAAFLPFPEKVEMLDDFDAEVEELMDSYPKE